MMLVRIDLTLAAPPCDNSGYLNSFYTDSHPIATQFGRWRRPGPARTGFPEGSDPGQSRRFFQFHHFASSGSSSPTVTACTAQRNE